jgi:3-deoxy-D-manno-octulosonic-acid transferase
LADVLQLWLEDPDAARSAGEAGRTVVEANRGATARTVDVLLELMGGVD